MPFRYVAAGLELKREVLEGKLRDPRQILLPGLAAIGGMAIPAAIFATVALLSGILHAIDPQHYAGPMFMLFSGGLMLGAVFMATDMVATPLTNRGVLIYGVLIAVLTVMIRYWGGLPEGVMYAILFANAASRHIDRLVQPRVYGTLKQAKRGS